MTKKNDARKRDDADFRDWDATLERRLRDDLDGFLADADVDLSADEANVPRSLYSAPYETQRRRAIARRLAIWAENGAALAFLASAVWFGVRSYDGGAERPDERIATIDGRATVLEDEDADGARDSSNGATFGETDWAANADWFERLEGVADSDWENVAVESARRVGEWTSASWRAFRPNFDKLEPDAANGSGAEIGFSNAPEADNAVERFAFDTNDRQNSIDSNIVDNRNDDGFIGTEHNDVGDGEPTNAVASVLKNDPVLRVFGECRLGESTALAKMVARVEEIDRFSR